MKWFAESPGIEIKGLRHQPILSVFRLSTSFGYFLLAFITAEIDAAMRVYLGGPVEEGAIQIGGKEERLAEQYPEDYSDLKTTLDQILNAATDWAKNKSADDHDSIYS